MIFGVVASGAAQRLLADAIGSSAAIGAASGVGTSIVARAGAAAGVGAASGVGSILVTGAGSAAGVGAGLAVGDALTSDGAGLAAGVGAGAAVGAKTAAAVGAASGVGAAAAVALVPFDPSQLASLRFWFKAGDETGSDDDPITQITDQSGTGNHATQATAGRRAILDTVGTLNGRNVIEFRSSSPDWYQWADVFSGFSEAMMILVCKMKADPPASQFDGGSWVAMGNGGNTSLFPFTTGGIFDDFASTGRPLLGDPATSLTQFNIFSHHSKSASFQFWINGDDTTTPFYSNTSNTFGITTTPYLGRDPSNSFHVNGYLAEMIICNSFLTATERKQLEGYLAHRHALTALLHASHPYKSTPP